MRFMSKEAWDEFGFSLAVAINTISSHQPSPEGNQARLKLTEAMESLTELGVFSEEFDPSLANY